MYKINNIYYKISLSLHTDLLSQLLFIEIEVVIYLGN